MSTPRKQPFDPYADGHIKRSRREQGQYLRRQRERAEKAAANPPKPLQRIARGRP